MTTGIKWAWITVAVVAIAFVGLLVALRVVSERLHERAMALAPKPAAIERYEALTADLVAAEANPSASITQDGSETPSDAVALALHTRLLDRHTREIESNERWQELLEAFYYNKDGVDLLDPQTWEPFREFLEGQQDFLAQLREAAAAGGPIYPLDFSKGPNMELPHLAKVRDMARLLQADGLWHAANGDFDTYAADMTAMFDLGNALSGEPILISQLVRIAIDSIAFEAIGAVPPGQLSPAQARDLQVAVQGAAAREPFAESLAGEAQLAFVSFDMIRSGEYESISGVEEMLGTGSGSLVDQAIGHIYTSPFGLPWVSADQGSYAEYMNILVDANKLPYYEARERLEQGAQQLAELPPTRVMTRRVVPPMERVGQAQARAEAMADLVRLGLEIEQYQAETGQLPQSLEQISGRLGGSVPVDPFTGAPYVYRPSGNSFQLYSLGRDLTDDGGTHNWREGDIVWRGKETKN